MLTFLAFLYLLAALFAFTRWVAGDWLPLMETAIAGVIFSVTVHGFAAAVADAVVRIFGSL